MLPFSQAGLNGPMLTHTVDCFDCDFRLNKVPAQDWPKGAARTLYEYKGNYPSTIDRNRGTTWQPWNLEGTWSQLKAWGDSSVVVGRIPEVCKSHLTVNYKLISFFEGFSYICAH